MVVSALLRTDLFIAGEGGVGGGGLQRGQSSIWLALLGRKQGTIADPGIPSGNQRDVKKIGWEKKIM